MTDLPAYVLRVLQLFDEHEEHEELWWRTDSKYAPITFFVRCNDVFDWGTADAEEITEADLPALEAALRDAEEFYCGPILFVARKRGQRPQGAMYKHLPVEAWFLFDQAGPVRERNLFNPVPHPSEGKHHEDLLKGEYFPEEKKHVEP